MDDWVYAYKRELYPISEDVVKLLMKTKCINGQPIIPTIPIQGMIVRVLGQNRSAYNPVIAIRGKVVRLSGNYTYEEFVAIIDYLWKPSVTQDSIGR